MTSKERKRSIPIYFDERWIGNHGIGRIAKEIKQRIKVVNIGLSGSQVSPIDPIKFFLKTLRLPKQSIILSPGFNAPIFVVRPFIFIVCDLNHLDLKVKYSFIKKLYYNIILKNACHKAYRVLTISEFSKNRIISWAKIPEHKILNIGIGLDSSFTKQGNKYCPDYSYLLSVSNRKPHKNEINTLKAFALAEIDKNIRFIFTGYPTKELNNLIINLGIQDRVIFFGRVDDEELSNLYRGALALIFPSLYEGFGLPVIEAMACGIPVLTSTLTSLPEAAGDAALLVNPNSREEISAGIEKILNDQKLRQEFIEKGLDRVTQYSWDNFTKKIELVIDELSEHMSKA